MSTTINVINKESFKINGKIKESFCISKLMDRNGNVSLESKCNKFYKNNISKGFTGSLNCPYGYTCLFMDKKIISGLIIKDKSNIKLIKGHYEFMKLGKIKYENNDVIENHLKISELEYQIQIKSSTFHDILNSNYFIYDLFDSLRNSNCYTQLKVYMDDYKKCFENYNRVNNELSQKYEDAKTIAYYYERIKLYDETFSKIDSIVTQILDFENDTDYKSEQSLFDFFSFVEYRLRYLNRIITNKSNEHLKYKNINLHRILTKLIKMFGHNYNSKQIKFNNNPNERYEVYARDDIFLALFILMENAIKYAELDSQINIYLSKDQNLEKCTIRIINKSKKIGIENLEDLKEKGQQGDNAINGNGLGLYTANEILTSQNLVLLLKYQDGFFSCEITI